MTTHAYDKLTEEERGAWNTINALILGDSLSNTTGYSLALVRAYYDDEPVAVVVVIEGYDVFPQMILKPLLPEDFGRLKSADGQLPTDLGGNPVVVGSDADGGDSSGTNLD